MSDWPSRLQVARWEFQRFVKPNQLGVSFVIMLLMGALGYGVAAWAKRADSNDSTVARVVLTARKLDGILILEGPDAARLIVRRNPVWKRALDAHLAEARQRLRLREAGLAPERLASMLAPVAVTTEFQSGNDGRAARVAAFVAVGLVLYGVFTSMAYMMVSVTAEKQLRVTEQVISAISPQTWIDGKILGISAVALVNVIMFLAGAAVWVLGRSIATGSRFSMGAAEPAAILWIVLFALLGFLFWLSLFGAVAATIDDPNTSTRGPLMFLPAFFSVAGMLVPMNSDSTFSRVSALIPLTSSAAMPARVALTDVPLWELLLSAALLVGGTLLARRAAGKVFSVAMLMYGKEPSWREIRRWVRET